MLVERGARFGIVRFGVSAVFVGGADPTPAQCRQANDCVLAARDRRPEATLIMAHLFGAGQRGLADIAPWSSVLADCCGGEPEAGRMERAVDALGADRIVFGSDAPGRSFATQLAKVLGARISEEAKRLILWGNAARLLPAEGLP